MENASKALLMAGGILISLLVVGALLLMFNQIGDYEKAQSSSEKASQVLEFNKQFTQYTYDDIKGYELISVINKAIDFNEKAAVGNSVDYAKKITIKVTLGQAFATKYGVDGKLKTFNTKTYEIKYSDNDFANVISEFSSLETKYTLGVMSKLSANYYSIKNGEKTATEVAGRSINIEPETIEQYREYSEFKNSTFRSNSDPVYDGDQVVELSFEFVK